MAEVSFMFIVSSYTLWAQCLFPVVEIKRLVKLNIWDGKLIIMKQFFSCESIAQKKLSNQKKYKYFNFLLIFWVF